MPKNFLVVHSYDRIGGHSGQGSMARIQDACVLIEEGRIPADSVVIFPQGFSKRDPTGDIGIRGESLGQNLARFAARQPQMRNMEIVAKPLSWGTLGDMKACYRMAFEHIALGQKPCFYHVTDPNHLRRVRLVWLMTRPRNWRAEFFAAPSHRLSRFERFVREPVALLVYFLIMLPGFLFGRKVV